MEKILNIGDKFPTFTLLDEQGISRNMVDFEGSKVILFFYPKDDTSGCTRESLEFTTAREQFNTYNTIILGVSPDSVESHKKFVAKHDLKITLLSDADKELSRKTNVWVEKSMYGKKYMGVERTSFLLNEQGIILAVWRKVKVAGHVEEVLQTLQNLNT